jgi:hypothetical protein
MREHGAGCGTDRVEAVAQLSLDIFEVHGSLDTSFGVTAG